MRLLSLPLALTVVACGSSPSSGLDASPDANPPDDAASADSSPLPDASPDASPDAGDLGPRYNEVQQKAIHNAYQRDEPLFDQIVFHRAHAVEIDIHNGKTLAPTLSGDWYVYHVDLPSLDYTTCDKLSDCLGVLRAMHDAFPQHEIVTVMIDLKDSWQTGQMPADLDAMFTARIGRQNILAPADLMAACPGASTLRDAVTGSCGWPRLASLRGKFLFALTGGSLCSASPLDGYVGSGGADATTRLGLVAPGIDDTCTFPASYATLPHAIFFNMDAPHESNAATVRAAGLVARVYYGGVAGGLDSQSDFDAAKVAQAHHLATDMVNYLYSPWTVMNGSKGWPFVCYDACSAPAAEIGMRLLGADVRSGDIGGTSDSFVFASDNVQGSVWTAAFSVESSHVTSLAKGCIMARATTDPGSPYVAVCRPADSNPIRSQARLTQGGSTLEKDSVAPSTLSSESTFFGRLTFNGTSATVEASTDGAGWQFVANYTFSAALPLQGIAVSGDNSANPVRFVFGNLARDGQAIDTSKLPNTTCIGSCPTMKVFDGPIP